MRTAVFLSVREKATRLPGKVLLEVAGRSMTEHLVRRLSMAEEPDQIIMTTSTDSRDGVLCELADTLGITSFRGSPEDKLVRYRDAAIEHEIDFFVVVDGDDIFCSEVHIDEIIRVARDGGDYIVPQGLPLGAAGFGLRASANARVCDLKAESDTEVWGGYFTRPGMFDVIQPEVGSRYRRPDYRMTLDYPEDLAFFTAVIEAMDGELWGFDRIIDHLDQHPEIVALNAAVAERYARDLTRAAAVTFRGQEEGAGP